MGRYFLLWLPMVLIAFGNAALREVWFRKHTGELQAHQISTASGIVLFGIYIWIVLRAWPPASSRQAWAVGLLWLGLTLAFESLLGRYVSDLSWKAILADYNLLAGRVWVFIPLWVLLAPPLFYRLQQR